MRRPPRELDKFGRYKCVKCGYRQPAERFRVDPAKADGRRHECWMCESADKKARRRARGLTDAERAGKRERDRRRRERLAGLVRAAKAAGLEPVPPPPPPWWQNGANQAASAGAAAAASASTPRAASASGHQAASASDASAPRAASASGHQAASASDASAHRAASASQPKHVTVAQLNAASLAAKATTKSWACGHDPDDFPGFDPALFDEPGFDPFDTSTWPDNSL